MMLQGAPYQMLNVPAASWQGVGLTDMALPAKGPYNAIATAQNGHVSRQALQPVPWHYAVLSASRTNCQHRKHAPFENTAT